MIVVASSTLVYDNLTSYYNNSNNPIFIVIIPAHSAKQTIICNYIWNVDGFSGGIKWIAW